MRASSALVAVVVVLLVAEGSAQSACTKDACSAIGDCEELTTQATLCDVKQSCCVTFPPELVDCVELDAIVSAFTDLACVSEISKVLGSTDDASFCGSLTAGLSCAAGTLFANDPTMKQTCAALMYEAASNNSAALIGRLNAMLAGLGMSLPPDVIGFFESADCRDDDVKCPILCTEEYQPMCGSVTKADGTKEDKEYGNACYLRSAMTCDNAKIDNIRKGACNPECPIFCIAEYKPVCAKVTTISADGSKVETYRNFSNACALDAAIKCDNVNAVKERPAACGIECSQICPAIYQPVCAKVTSPTGAVAYVTYSNECRLNVAIECDMVNAVKDRLEACGVTTPNPQCTTGTCSSLTDCDPFNKKTLCNPKTRCCVPFPDEFADCVNVEKIIKKFELDLGCALNMITAISPLNAGSASSFCPPFSEGLKCLAVKMFTGDEAKSNQCSKLMYTLVSRRPEALLDEVLKILRQMGQVIELPADISNFVKDPACDPSAAGTGPPPTMPTKPVDDTKPDRPVPNDLEVCVNREKIFEKMAKCASSKTPTTVDEVCTAVKRTVYCVATALLGANSPKTAQCAALIKDILPSFVSRLPQIANYSPQKCLVQSVVCGVDNKPLDNHNCSRRACPDDYECKRDYCCPKEDPGMCPKPTRLPICNGTCNVDKQCGNGLKCCDIGCSNGKKTCVRSETHTKSKCEKEFDRVKELVLGKGSLCNEPKYTVRIPECKNGMYAPVVSYIGTGKLSCVDKDGRIIVNSEHTEGNVDCTKVHHGTCRNAVRESECTEDNTINECMDDSKCTSTEKCCLKQVRDPNGDMYCKRECQQSINVTNSLTSDLCPNPMCCPVTMCLGRRCPAYKGAKCQVNNCGKCSADFVLDGKKVDCFQGLSTCQKKRAIAIEANTNAGLTDGEKLRKFIESKKPKIDTRMGDGNMVWEVRPDAWEDATGDAGLDYDKLPEDKKAKCNNSAESEMDKMRMMYGLCMRINASGMCKNGGYCGLGADMDPFEFCKCPPNFHGLFCEIQGQAASDCLETKVRQATLMKSRTKNPETDAEKMTEYVYNFIRQMNPIIVHFSCSANGKYDTMQAGQSEGNRMIYICVDADTGKRVPFTQVSYDKNLDCDVTTEVEPLSLPSQCVSSAPAICVAGKTCQYFFNPLTQICQQGAAGGGFNSISKCYDACGHGKKACPTGTMDCARATPKPCESMNCDYKTQYCKVTHDATTGVVTGRCKNFQDYCLTPPSEGVGSQQIGAYFYNATCRRCEKFVYTGAGGNKNRFTNLHQCHAECSVQDYKFANPSCPPPRSVGMNGDLEANECVDDNECMYDQVCCSSGKALRCVDPIQSCLSGQRCSQLDYCSDVGEPCQCPTCDSVPTGQVCGSDGNTYQSECLLNHVACRTVRNITVLASGQCVEARTDDPCNKPCTKEYRPVCGLKKPKGSNEYRLNTYNNLCLLHTEANCLKDTTSVMLLYDGACRNTSCGDGHCMAYQFCDKESKQCVCPQRCTEEYKPVCAHPYDNENSMEEFTSICQMQKAACERQALFVVSKYDKCRKTEYECPDNHADSEENVKMECDLTNNDHCGTLPYCCPYGSGSKCVAALVPKKKSKEGTCPSSGVVARSVGPECTEAACRADSECPGKSKCCANDACGDVKTCIQPLVCGAGNIALPNITCDTTATTSQCPTGATCTSVSLSRVDGGEITSGICCQPASRPVDKEAIMGKMVCAVLKAFGIGCQNGGTCTGDIKGLPLCTCARGFYGLLCQKRIPEEKCSSSVSCLALPCRVNSCPKYPNATCKDNYCGGCNALYTYNGRDVTTGCNDTPCLNMEVLVEKIKAMSAGYDAPDMEDDSGEDDSGESDDDDRVAEGRREKRRRREDHEVGMAEMGFPEATRANFKRLAELMPYIPTMPEGFCDARGHFPKAMCFTELASMRQFCTCVDQMGEFIKNAPRTRTIVELNNCSVMTSGIPEGCLETPILNKTCAEGTTERFFFNKTSQRCEAFPDGGCTKKNSFPDMETCASSCRSKEMTLTMCARVRCGSGTTCKVIRGQAQCVPNSRPTTPPGKTKKAFEPMCEDDGSYRQKQCYGDMCACVDPNTGEIQDGPFPDGTDFDCNDPSTFPTAEKKTCGNGEKPKFCDESGDPCTCRPKSMPDMSSTVEACTACQTCSRPTTCNLDCSQPSCKNYPNARCTVNACTCRIEYKAGNKIVDCNELHSDCERLKADYDAENNEKMLRMGSTNASVQQIHLKCKDNSYEAICFNSGCQCLHASSGQPVGQLISKATLNNVDCTGVFRKTLAKLIKVKSTVMKYENWNDAPKARRDKIVIIVKELKSQIEKRYPTIKVIAYKLSDGSVKVEFTLQEREDVQGQSDLASTANAISQDIKDGEISADVEGEQVTLSEAQVTELVFEEEEVDDDDDESDSKKTVIIAVAVVAAVVVVLVAAIAVYCYMESRKSAKSDDIRFSDIEGKSNPTYMN